MARYRINNFGGINLAVNPLALKGGDLLRSVNVETAPYGAKRKRPGYTTYLGTMPNGSPVQDLMNWTLNNGTQFWNYALAGGNLYYSTQGTGAWTICGNGTLSNVGTLTSAVLENTLVVGDGVSATRHSTTGTSFTNTSSAPIAVSLSEYHQRIYAAGTSSNNFWSTTGTATDWTSDSSSILVPGAGKINSIFKSADRLINTKNSGQMFKYDEFSLLDTVTDLGPTSTRSIASIEDDKLYLNRQGFYHFSGASPQLLSKPIERQVYNDVQTGIAGTSFDSAPGVAHQYRYYCTVGTVTDDLTSGTVPGCVEVYDYLWNQWWNYSYANTPSAWLSYEDATFQKQLIFANGSQCYQISGTLTSDNGVPIEAQVMGVVHLDAPELDKDWKYIWAMANPGCEGQVQVALADTFTNSNLTWQSLGDFVDGVSELRFPTGARSKLLFWKFAESSTTARFSLYGLSCEAEPVERYK